MRDVWSFAQQMPAESYDAMRANFRWQVPETFNFATDGSTGGRGRDGPALIWQNAAGDERGSIIPTSRSYRTNHGRTARAGRREGRSRYHHAAAATEWFISVIAAMRIGAVPIRASKC